MILFIILLQYTVTFLHLSDCTIHNLYYNISFFALQVILEKICRIFIIYS